MWGLWDADAGIKAPEAWDATTGSSSVVVGVIDTGVDYSHPELNDNMWTNAAEVQGQTGVDDDNNGYVDDIYGWDFVSNDADPMDDHYHGTHVSGTIGAEGNNGVGITGVSWDVKIMALKFLNSNGSGATSGAIKAIAYATANGADITNNSWGGGGYSSMLAAAIEDANANDSLFIAAAGNADNDNDASASYPASYPNANIIAVASITSSGAKSSFSSYGETSVDIGAPGSSIYSTAPSSSYRTLSGTSMATPHVAGVAALVKASGVDGADAIKSQIMNMGTDSAAMSGITVSGKILNARDAVAQTGTISGAVTNADTGAAIEGATVVADDGNGRRFSSTTASNGTYSLGVIPATYTVTASKYQFTTASQNGVDVIAESTTTANHSMTPVPLATVSGSVTTSNGAPIAGATITVTDTPGPITATTDGDGSYAISLAEGGYTLAVSSGKRCDGGTNVAITVAGDTTKDVTISARSDAAGHTCTELSTFNWIDTDTQVPFPGDELSGGQWDETSATIEMPFAFPFFGANYSTVYVSENGYVNFLGESRWYWRPASIPAASGPNGAIYGFWTDFVQDVDPVAGQTGVISYSTTGTAPNRVFTVEYDNVRKWGSLVWVSFEIQLHERGFVDVLIKPPSNESPTLDGRQSTVGIENSAGTDAFELSYKQRLTNKSGGSYQNTAYRYYTAFDISAPDDIRGPSLSQADGVPESTTAPTESLLELLKGSDTGRR